jgi:ABC-type multidrug transport system ATPase subunit
LTEFKFDVLWDDLSIKEHLYFYARIKGITAQNETHIVEEALQRVKLHHLGDRLTKRLSGGEKRRLSIAIALVGSPSVVFLDEPSTGLDPEVRRMIWDIIDKSREGKAIVLVCFNNISYNIFVIFC